jgi:hypothetical protein
MDDVVEFPRARTKPLSEDEALERLRQAGRIEGIGTFAELVGWEPNGSGTARSCARRARAIRP